MSSPDLIAADRLDSLLAGDPPESVREAVVQGLVRELRAAAPAAPASLRARLSTEGERVDRRPVNRSRLAIVLAAALAVAALSAALLVGDPGNAWRTADREVTARNLSAAGSATVEEESDTHGTFAQAAPLPAWETANGAVSGGDINESTLSGADATTLGGHRASDFDGVFDMDARARDVKMTMELRLPNAEKLSDAAKKAMRTTARLGGVVAASRVDTSGATGTGTLQLQIPVAKLDQAIAELSQLGTITKQDVAARDLQASVDQTTTRIRHLRAAIAADKLRLESGTLTDAQKLDVQLRLIRERQQLDQIRRERAAYLAEAATAEVTLGLHTGRNAVVGPSHGTFRRTLDSGLTALSKVAAVALLALIVAAPLVLLGALVSLVARSRRRRIEAEILNRPRPATPSTPPPA